MAGARVSLDRRVQARPSRLGALIGATVLATATAVASGCGSSASSARSTSSSSAPTVKQAGPSGKRPHALEFLINGKRFPIVPIVGGPDDYAAFRARTMKAEARWTTDAGGTGYQVVISTAEPDEQNYATCSTGTSCRVAQGVPIAVGHEFSWNVKVVRTSDSRTVAGYKVCLMGA
jgi:hypothetical protein